MDKLSINKRFIECVNYLVSTENEAKGDVSRKIGIKVSTFSEILNNRMNVATDHIARFIANYSNISAEWILTGRGNMINVKNTTDELPKDINEIIDLATQLGEQINENKHLYEKNMQLKAKIEKLNAENENLKKELKNKSNPRQYSSMVTEP